MKVWPQTQKDSELRDFQDMPWEPAPKTNKPEAIQLLQLPVTESTNICYAFSLNPLELGFCYL